MNKIYKIAIVGGGWFGCHIGNEIKKAFKKKVYFNIFEEKKDIFNGASGYNQNRLHLGFHYPRSNKTIIQSKLGFYKFINRYPKFSKKIKKNIYAISSSKKSYINFNQYCSILDKNGLFYNIEKKHDLNPKKIDGAILCEERQVLTDVAKNFFKKKLKDHLVLNYKVNKLTKKNNKIIINNFDEEYDMVINCSWQKFQIYKTWKTIFEPCITFLYKPLRNINNSCITIMDGPFFTLYKWDKKYFNLYSVKYSRLKKYISSNKSEKYLTKIKKLEIINLRKKIEFEFSKYYPDFKKNFKFSRYLSTVRTIKVNDKNDDDRSFDIKLKDKEIEVLSGKIDHICLVSEKINKWLKKKIKY